MTPCSLDELRKLFLFEKLTDDQLGWLCRQGHVEHFEPGPLYAEGEPAECLYVLLDGALVMSRRVGADDVETGRTSSVGVYTGAFMAYLGDRVPQVYNNSVRITEPSRFFRCVVRKYMPTSRTRTTSAIKRDTPSRVPTHFQGSRTTTTP